MDSAGWRHMANMYDGMNMVNSLQLSVRSAASKSMNNRERFGLTIFGCND